MNSQISLAMVLTLCLSNAAQRGFGKKNVTLDGVASDIKELLNQSPDKRAIGQKLMSVILEMVNSTSANESSSDGASATTRTVNTQTTDNKTSNKTSTTRQPVTSQPTDSKTSNRPSTTKQPVISQPTDSKTSNRPSTTKQPVTSQPTESKTSNRTSTTKPPVTPQPTDKKTTSNKTSSTSQPVTTTDKKPSSSPSLATTQLVSSNTTTNRSIEKGGTRDFDTNNKSERDGNQLSHHAGNFPVFFMLILVVVVAGYFAYHNKTKIHRFIKEGYGKAKQTGTAYVKVKLDDDIELPREANRQYVY